MNTSSAARVFRCRALVPVWFVLVGTVAAWAPAPTVPIALTVLVLTVGIAPALLVGWLYWHPDPLRRRHTAGLAEQLYAGA